MSAFNISITIEAGKASIIAPYNSKFVKALKNLRGAWDRPAWRVDAEDVERVRALCREVFGCDDTVQPTCTVQLDLDLYGMGDSVEFSGVEVVRRTGRDESVELAPSTFIIEGGFASRGGSMKYPEVGNPDPGTIVELRRVPMSVAEGMRAAKGVRIIGDVRARTIQIVLTGELLNAIEAEAREGRTPEAAILDAIELYVRRPKSNS